MGHRVPKAPSFGHRVPKAQEMRHRVPKASCHKDIKNIFKTQIKMRKIRAEKMFVYTCFDNQTKIKHEKNDCLVA